MLLIPALGPGPRVCTVSLASPSASPTPGGTPECGTALPSPVLQTAPWSCATAKVGPGWPAHIFLSKVRAVTCTCPSSNLLRSRLASQSPGPDFLGGGGGTGVCAPPPALLQGGLSGEVTWELSRAFSPSIPANIPPAASPRGFQRSSHSGLQTLLRLPRPSRAFTLPDVLPTLRGSAIHASARAFPWHVRGDTFSRPSSMPLPPRSPPDFPVCPGQC